MNHPLHALCPYFAMFPPSFVLDQLLAYSKPNDLVFDPFSGRGTTILEALLNDRNAIATDINLVAACVSGAKAEVPSQDAVISRLEQLEAEANKSNHVTESLPAFFHACFHQQTLSEIVYLRKNLSWATNPIDRYIAALMLGALHGESHRSTLCLSNRMPRTISTKPDYSMRWWADRGYIAPYRKTFKVLVETMNLRYKKAPPKRKGCVKMIDARKSSEVYFEHNDGVDLVVTSPPYLDTTDFAEDQWLRLWFLGGSDKPTARLNRDDRHTQSDKYWNFLTETWVGCAPLMKSGSTLVVRIGGPISETEMCQRLEACVLAGFSNHRVVLHTHSSSEIKKRQTNVFRPGTKEGRREYDFVFHLS